MVLSRTVQSGLFVNGVEGKRKGCFFDGGERKRGEGGGGGGVKREDKSERRKNI